MHLLSHNGPIDVLVCPEADDEISSPKITTNCNQSYRDLDVSLSSIASTQDENINGHDGIIDTFPELLAQGVGGTNTTNGCDHAATYLPLDMFESLSPPCNDDEFYPTLSPNEGIMELFDLA